MPAIGSPAQRAELPSADDLWDCLPDALLLVDPAGGIAAANAQARALLDDGQRALTGRTLGALVPGFPPSIDLDAPTHTVSAVACRRADGQELLADVAVSCAPTSPPSLLVSIRPVPSPASPEGHDRSTLQDERNRIAEELQSQVVRKLCTSSASVQAMAARMTDPAAADALCQVVEELDLAISAIRRSVFPHH